MSRLIKSTSLIKSEKKILCGLDGVLSDIASSQAAEELIPDDKLHSGGMNSKAVSVAEQQEALMAIAQEQADAILADAHRQAEEIIFAAQGEAAAILQNAHQEGENAKQEIFRQAEQSGIQAGEEHAKSLVIEAKNILDQVVNEKNRVLQEMEGEVVKLSLAIVNKLIKTELFWMDEIVLGVVKEALRKAHGKAQLSIRVNPGNYQTVSKNRGDFLGLVEGLQEIEVIEDTTVGPGGCIVETGLGTIDARIENQLQEIEKVILECLGNVEFASSDS